jgi:hypothetical protein
MAAKSRIANRVTLSITEFHDWLTISKPSTALVEGMSRSCRTCQHLKRPEIDRLLAAGEPVSQMARFERPSSSGQLP